jgi:hypothetical protein
MTTNADAKTETQDALLAKRKPTVSTLRTYTSLLSALNRKMGGEKELKFFTQEATNIKEYIAKMDKPQSRKTILSALFVLTSEASYTAPRKCLLNGKKVAFDCSSESPQCSHY